MEMTMTTIKKEDDLGAVLSSLFGFDEDHTGNNGIEYTREETINAGFESNLEYWIDSAMKNNEHLADMIDSIVEEYKKDNHYTYLIFEMITEEDMTIVSLAWHSDN